MNTNQHIDLRRYSRQTMLAEIGEEGQRRLLASSVLIVGLGGLGAAVATYLTGAGVGRIGLCDPTGCRYPTCSGRCCTPSSR